MKTAKKRQGNHTDRRGHGPERQFDRRVQLRCTAEQWRRWTLAAHGSVSQWLRNLADEKVSI